MAGTGIHSAFQDAPREAQTVFRIVMDAIARPGSVHDLTPTFQPPTPLFATAAAITLTLADFETSIWLDDALRQSPVTDFLRFHTGAKLIEEPAQASFALIGDIAAAPDLSAFAQGTPDYPDRSTTLIVQITSFQPKCWRMAGPGIEGKTDFGFSPMPDGFEAQLRDNRAQFPLGVDLILANQTQIAAMPRSTQIIGTA